MAVLSVEFAAEGLRLHERFEALQGQVQPRALGLGFMDWCPVLLTLPGAEDVKFLVDLLWSGDFMDGLAVVSVSWILLISF